MECEATKVTPSPIVARALRENVIRITPYQGKMKKGRKYTECPDVVPDKKMVVPTADFSTCMKTLIHRILYVKGPVIDGVQTYERPPHPIRNIYRTQLSSLRRRIIKHTLNGLVRLIPYTDEERVLASPSSKRALYAKALNDLSDSLPDPRDAKVKDFIKFEKIASGKIPRGISPRHIPHLAWMGKYILPAEKNIYRAFHEIYGGPTVMKGYNADEQAAHIYNMWNQFADPVAIGLDAVAFDQHVHYDALKWEHSIYTELYGGNDRENLRRVIDRQLINAHTFISNDGFKIFTKVKGGRCSGDMNTSLGNCTIMCTLIKHLAETLRINVRLANNGDDCVLITDRQNERLVMQRLPQYFLDYGFTIKVEKPVYVFEHIEFCQTHPVFVAGKPRMVRNPFSAIVKDMMMLHNDSSTYPTWLTTVGHGGLALCSGVPIMQEFYSSLIRLSARTNVHHAKFMDTGLARLSEGMEERYSDVDVMTRYSFYLAFGVNIGMQHYYEDRWRGFVLGSPGQGINPQNYIYYPYV